VLFVKVVNRTGIFIGVENILVSSEPLALMEAASRGLEKQGFGRSFCYREYSGQQELAPDKMQSGL
jgi:hypothetical protein